MLSRPRGAGLAAALTTTALALAACSAGGTGTRDEGPAQTAPMAPASPSPTTAPAPSPTPSPPMSIDAVKLVMGDPEVSPKIKSGLRRCGTDGYPVDMSYGNLTGAASGDVVVNILTCDDSMGLGSYVYQPEPSKDGRPPTYKHIFQEEQPPVYAEIDRGDLVVTKQVYQTNDTVSYPSGEDVITYRWSKSANRFTEQDRTYNAYSRAAGGGASPSPSTK